MKFRSFLLFCTILAMGSCSSYKQNIMLKLPEGSTASTLSKEVVQAERNYLIQKNDLLRLDVYTNKGERIIDPNPSLTQNAATTTEPRPEHTYLVDLNGIAKFPIIGEMKMETITLRHAETLLQAEYEKYFKDAFVVLTFENKRVIVLGAIGGLVVPLTNQNMTVAEILALSKGLPNDSKSHNIRLVRRDQVFVLNFSTTQGFISGNMIVEPGDIIYLEPVRKPFAEGLRDYAGLASLLVSTLSLLIVIQSTK